MDDRVTKLRNKEIIDIQNGSRYGYVGDLEIDLESGRVMALVIPGRLRLFGLLGRERERVFPWDSVCRFGEDIILVDGAHEMSLTQKRKK